MTKYLLSFLFLTTLFYQESGMGVCFASNKEILDIELDRCPVCHRKVYKSPQWIAMVYYEKDGRLKHLAFDGVKVMLRFLYNPVRWGYPKDFARHVKRMVVRDFDTRKPVWAKEAWYVVGGDVEGPHGVALIPFVKKEDAWRFLKQHGGLRMLRFEQLTPALIQRLSQER